MAEGQENTWACEACTFHNVGGASACEMCGTPNPSNAGSGGDDESSAYWSCQACTMQNPSVTFTCHLCGTVNEERRAKAKEAGDGGAEDGVSPALLARLARDGHFSLQNYLTKLSHTLALAAAEAETGLSRPNIDRAFIPVLLELMSDPGNRRGPDIPLQACRALNYFLQIGAAGDVGVQQGMRTYALCITCAATAGTAEYQELGQEAVSGVDLLCRTSAEFLRELAETDIGGGGGKVLASFVRSVYRPAGGSRRNSVGPSPSVNSPAAAGLTAEDRRNSGSNNRLGAGSGAETAVAKALSLLPSFLGHHPRPKKTVTAPGDRTQPSSSADKGKGGGTAGAVAAAVGSTGDVATSASPDASASARPDGEDELEAVIGALLAVLRLGSVPNRQTALAVLGSKVLPRLGGAAPERREWLGELITDEELLVAAIEDRSSRGRSCHLQALGLTYQLLASSPELMSLALEPACPLLPAVLDALDDGGDTPGLRAGGAAAVGVDGSGSGRRLTASRAGDGGGVVGGGASGAPAMPKSAPRTSRLAVKSIDRRGGRATGVADGEATGRSGLAVLRIVGLVATAFLDGRLPKSSSLLFGGGWGDKGTWYNPGPVLMVQVQPERHSAPAGTGALVDGSGTSTSGVGGGNKGGTATVAAGTRQAAQGSSIVSASARRSGGSSGGGGGGGGTKENHDRRAKLLADLGDGTVLVSWANTGVEEVIAAKRILMPSTSITTRARRSLARNSLFRTMLSLGGDPGSGDSDSNGDGGLGTEDDPLANFSLNALSALAALGGGGRGGGGSGGGGGGGRGASGGAARAERSILNDFLGQFIHSGSITTVRHVLAGGADPNRLVKPGQSALMAAAAHGAGPAVALEMTRALLDAGADAGFSGPNGSALHAAASLGRGEVVSALIEAGADLDATDSDGCTALEVCNDESVMLLLTQALEAAEETGGSSESSPSSTKRSESQTTVAGSERGKGARGAGLREGDKKKAGASGSSKSLVATTTMAGEVATSAKVEEEKEEEGEEIDPLHRTVGVAGTEDGAAGGAVMVKEEPVVLDLPEDRSRMICVLLQALSQSFMVNAAASQGLSTALAPPVSTAGGGGPGNTRSGGNVSGRGGGAGGTGANASAPRENAAQHTVSVSLGKAWLEILVKLMRRASSSASVMSVGGVVVGGGPVTGRADAVAASLDDMSTRDALLALFERTAAGVAAAAAAAAGTAEEEQDSGCKKAPSWADPALVLRSFVLLREVLERVPEAYVVPLRRRGVLHSIRTVIAAAATSPRAGVQPPTSRSLDMAIAVAAKEVVELCDAYEKTHSVARSASIGERGGSGPGGEAVDRLAATAESLREAMAILRRHGKRGDTADAAPDEEHVAAAAHRALTGVKDLAQLLASEDGITAFEALESGVLHPLRDLLAWLEESLVGETAVTDACLPCLTPAVKVAEQLEREAVGALALVPTLGPLYTPAGEGSGETHRVRSEAVLELLRLIHDVIGVEALQAEGPDSRRAPPSGTPTSVGGGHGLLFGARGLFGSGVSGGSGGGDHGSGAGGSGLEALSLPIMLQLRPSKTGMCRVRARGGGGDDVLVEASLPRSAGGGRGSSGGAARGGGGGGRGRGGGAGAGGGAGRGVHTAAESLTILASVQPLAKLSQLRDFVLRSIHISHPVYLEYCRGLFGAMVCIKPRQGAHVGGGGGGGLFEQGLLGGELFQGRDGRAPWEGQGQGQGRGTGQGRLFRVVGWDEQTGTHLLLSVPGVEEDTPWEQYLQVVLAEMFYRLLLPEKAQGGAGAAQNWKPESSGAVATIADAGTAAVPPDCDAAGSTAPAGEKEIALPGAGVWGDVEPRAATESDLSAVKPSPLLMELRDPSFNQGEEEGEESESDDMELELEDFAFGENSAAGASWGKDGGSKGIKAAASTAASSISRNVRSILIAQQNQRQHHNKQKQQQQQNQKQQKLKLKQQEGRVALTKGSNDAAAAAELSPVTATSCSPSSTVPHFRASASDGGGAAAGAGHIGDASGPCPPSPFPALVDSPLPPLSSNASGSVVGCAGLVVAGEGSKGLRVSTAPSTPLSGTTACGVEDSPAAEGRDGAAAATPPLKEGDSVEAQFLLADQEVWTTSWYRGQVSRVNGGGALDGAKVVPEGEKGRKGTAEGKDASGGVTYGVAFSDGDRLDEVPESHIRPFRGLQVGSVVSVEWPGKGGRPYKGCLTRVRHGAVDGLPTVSVVYEDTDTENNVPLERLRLAEDEFLAPPLPIDSTTTSSKESSTATSTKKASTKLEAETVAVVAAPSTPGSSAAASSAPSLTKATAARSTSTPGGGRGVVGGNRGLAGKGVSSSLNRSPRRGSSVQSPARRGTNTTTASAAASTVARMTAGRGGDTVGGGGAGGRKQDRSRLTAGKYGRATAGGASTGGDTFADSTAASSGTQLAHTRSGSDSSSLRRGVMAAANASATRRVWVRDHVDCMRWRPGCLVADGEEKALGASGLWSGGRGAEAGALGPAARLDDGTIQALRPDGLMDFPTMGGSVAAAEAAASAGGSGAGRGVRNPAAKLASLTGALRRHGRNAGIGGSSGGEDDVAATTFCKEPATPHAWLFSRQPRTPLGFLPRLGGRNNQSGGTNSGGGGGGGTGSGGGAGKGGKGGKDFLDPPNLRRHFTTVSAGGIDAAGAAGGRAGRGGSGAEKAPNESGGASTDTRDGGWAGRTGGNGLGALGDSKVAKGGKKMSIFSGFGGANNSKGGGGRSRQRGGSSSTSAGGEAHRHQSAAAGARARAGAVEESVRAVPLQLEDEGLLQEQGWVYPPRVHLLLAVSTDPESNGRASWVELDEEDTIFKCVSILQARAPSPAPGQTPSAAAVTSVATGTGPSIRGHNLVREGFMGLKRSLGRGRGAEHVLFFRVHVSGGPTSVAEGKKTNTGARVPSEGDIRELSPSLEEALLMARSVRNLCARHQSELAMPLGRWCNGNGNGSREGEDEDEGAALANAQLWVNDELADVRDFSFLQQLSVREALSDTLAVAAGFLPPWVDALLSGFPFLLPLDLRMRYFRSLAFGVTRSVAYLQQESAAGVGGGNVAGGGTRGSVGGRSGTGQRGGGIGGGFMGGGRAGGVRAGGVGAGGLGALRRDIVQVSRTQLLQHAEQVMSMYTPSKSVLEFRFAGEKGLGAGVTASFYSAVAAELQRRSVNSKIPMWVDDDSLGDPQGFLSPPSGLFPAPVPPSEQLGDGDSASGGAAGRATSPKSKALIQWRRLVIGRFRFLGRLAARCLMDGQVLPLPLSVDFLRLVLAVVDDHARSQGQDKTASAAASAEGATATSSAESVVVGERGASVGMQHANGSRLFSIEDLPRLYHRPGVIVRSLARACAREDASSREVDGLPLPDFLELSSLAMTDPLSGTPLVLGGEDVDVTADNVNEYVDAVTSRWLHVGLIPQADAFRTGCAEVFPVHMLRAMSPRELRDQLCGQEALEWPLEHLQEAVVPGAGYTRNSQPFCNFLKCLSEMTAAAKRSFLLFVLGCPHLPPGGLCALSPPLEVSRKQGAGGAFALEDELHLPPYSRFEVLVGKLRYAIDNSKGVIDRD